MHVQAFYIVASLCMHWNVHTHTHAQVQWLCTGLFQACTHFCAAYDAMCFGGCHHRWAMHAPMAACLKSLLLGLHATAGLGYNSLSTKPPTITKPSYSFFEDTSAASCTSVVQVTTVETGPCWSSLYKGSHLPTAAMESLWPNSTITSQHKSIVVNPYNAPLSVKTRYHPQVAGCLWQVHCIHIMYTHTYYDTVHNQRCCIMYCTAQSLSTQMLWCAVLCVFAYTHLLGPAPVYFLCSSQDLYIGLIYIT